MAKVTYTVYIFVFLHKSKAIQGNSLCLLYTEQLAELPAILDSFFAGVANATSTPIVWEGGGQAGSQEVMGKGYVFTKNSQMTSIGIIFITTCHTKQLHPRANSSASHVVIHSQLSACQGKIGSFEGYPRTLWTSDRLEKEA